jgi:mannan endo-1,4-beta-mannosidase
MKPPMLDLPIIRTLPPRPDARIPEPGLRNDPEPRDPTQGSAGICARQSGPRGPGFALRTAFGFRILNSGFVGPFVALLVSTTVPSAAPSVLRDFVEVRGDQLVEGGRPFRFISFNIPNLHLVEDNVAFAEPNPWRLPDRFEITDALASVHQQGGTVVRSYVLSVVRTNDTPGAPRHVLGPGRFNEDAFRALDLVLQIANEQGVRVIVPFVDNWSWWGGIAEYAGFRGKPKEAFWTDPQIIDDFKATVRHLVTRKNTLTGVRYCDDKAILCWETGNELQSPAPWTREIAAFIKTLDHNHPVMDGYHTTELRPESLAMPEVDLVTTHHYPGGRKAFADLIRENWAKAKGKKPYVVGEFGFVDTAQMAAALDAVVETGTAGALAWSLRYRNRDGGFYWHSEPAGGNKYKAFHWPGFASGADYDEVNLMALMRRTAYEIRGLPLPPVPVPAPPKLLPITDAAAISWQGSAGATSYLVERAGRKRGPWTVASENTDETAVQYRPLFADTRAPQGAWFYRVRARNDTGLSQPSNVVGPVKVTHATLVDELADFAKLHSQVGALEIQTRDCRKAKEDAHRLAGAAGSMLVYRVPGPIRSCRLDAFFPKAVADFRFSASRDGQAFTPIPAGGQPVASGAGDYGYWTPVRFQCQPSTADARFLKIEFAAEAQIGRVEIHYGQ